MSFVIAPLTAIPHNGEEIRASLRADRESAPNSPPRYSDKPNTFQYAGHDIEIRWDAAGMEATGADLTPEAQRRRGLLTKIVDCLFRGIPWSGKNIELSDHQIAYVMACNSHYAHAFEHASALMEAGNPSEASWQRSFLNDWLKFLPRLLTAPQTPELLLWGSPVWTELDASHRKLKAHRAEIKEAKLRQELGESGYRDAKAAQVRRENEEQRRLLRENPGAAPALFAWAIVRGFAGSD